MDSTTTASEPFSTSEPPYSSPSKKILSLRQDPNPNTPASKWYQRSLEHWGFTVKRTPLVKEDKDHQSEDENIWGADPQHEEGTISPKTSSTSDKENMKMEETQSPPSLQNNLINPSSPLLEFEPFIKINPSDPRGDTLIYVTPTREIPFKQCFIHLTRVEKVEDIEDPTRKRRRRRSLRIRSKSNSSFDSEVWELASPKSSSSSSSSSTSIKKKKKGRGGGSVVASIKKTRGRPEGWRKTKFHYWTTKKKNKKKSRKNKEHPLDEKLPEDLVEDIFWLEDHYPPLNHPYSPTKFSPNSLRTYVPYLLRHQDGHDHSFHSSPYFDNIEEGIAPCPFPSPTFKIRLNEYHDDHQ